MKIQLFHGFLIAAACLLVSALLTLTGLHADASKLPTANTIFSVLNLVILIAGLASGMRLCRLETPPDQPFRYPSALAAGVMVAVFAGLFGVITTYVYFQWIDPGFHDLLVQAQTEKLLARGIDPDKVERTTRFFTSSGFMAVSTFFGTVIGGTIISLIVAAFFRREAPPPSLESAPS